MEIAEAGRAGDGQWKGGGEGLGPHRICQPQGECDPRILQVGMPTIS